MKQKTVKIPECKTESRYSEQLIRENIPARHDMHETFSVEIGANGRYFFFTLFRCGEAGKREYQGKNEVQNTPVCASCAPPLCCNWQNTPVQQVPDPLSLDFLIKFI